MAVTLTYHGHSTFGVDAGGVKLLVDPFLAPNNSLALATADDVDAEYILITHGHVDHIADAVSVAQRTGATCISNFEIGNWLEAQGVEKVHTMHIGGGADFPFGRLKLTIAHHGSVLPDGSNGGNPAGILINFNDGTDLYFAGDTALTYDMKLIGEAGGVDVAVLPIGDNYTMGPEDAMRAAEFVEARRVIPCHYNTFPPIIQDADAFAAKLHAHTGIDCTVLQPGEEMTID